MNFIIKLKMIVEVTWENACKKLNNYIIKEKYEDAYNYAKNSKFKEDRHIIHPAILIAKSFEKPEYKYLKIIYGNNGYDYDSLNNILTQELPHNYKII